MRSAFGTLGGVLSCTSDHDSCSNTLRGQKGSNFDRTQMPGMLQITRLDKSICAHRIRDRTRTLAYGVRGEGFSPRWQGSQRRSSCLALVECTAGMQETTVSSMEMRARLAAVGCVFSACERAWLFDKRIASFTALLMRQYTSTFCLPGPRPVVGG